MRARIYRPSRNTMQSGRGNLRHWLLEYELETPRRPEPLMGWVSSGDTLNQVRLRFSSEEEAVAYAKRKGIDYTVQHEQERRVTPRSYSDNFRPRPS
ncbi:MAG: ETC complex I subunit [Rhodospirillaceae bacterium]|nr:ETC complex I subunit [Rhodospirillaceae bacterium]